VHGAFSDDLGVRESDFGAVHYAIATELWPPIVADAHPALPDRFFQSRPSNESSALN
jgi:hypothetical protein